MTSSWAEAALLRQGLYRFVGGALQPPVESTASTLRSAAAYLDDMGTAGYGFHREWSAVVAALNTLNGNGMSADFVRLFASGSDFALCPPVESYYLGDAKGSATGEIGALVSQRARRLGLALVSTPTPPDHIVTEMEIMSAICGREAAAWNADAGPEAVAKLDDEEQFLTAHPVRWVPQFRARVREVGAEGFYRSVIDFAHAYVVHDVDYVRAALAFFEGKA